MKQEPLLNEEEEKIVFRNSNNKSKKINKDVVILFILTFIVVYIFSDTLYRFYLGFKYYDYNSNDEIGVIIDDTNNSNNNEEEIPLNSVILNNTYNKINLDNCSNSISLLKRFYDNSLTMNELTDNEKATVIFNTFVNNNCLNNFILSVDEFNKTAKSIFNIDNFADNFLNSDIIAYDNFLVNYDSNTNSFIINQEICNTCNSDFIKKSIVKATIKDDELYIYEKFGYFQFVENNTYNVYSNLMDSELLSTYVDAIGDKNFTDLDLLKTYKWTYKKGNDNNYYFVSIIQI